MDTDQQPTPASQTQSSVGSESPDPAQPQGFVAATTAELGKVVWPSRSQLFSESIAVILMVGLSAAAIAGVDRFYSWLVVQVFR